MPWPPVAPTAAELYAIAKSSLPRFLFQGGVVEPLWAAAATLARVGRFIDERYLQSHIGRSTGIWVDSHLADRGMVRRSSESDEVARERARRIDDAATPAALEAAANAMLVEEGLDPIAYLVQFGPDGGYVTTVDGTTIAFADLGWRAHERVPRWSALVLPYGTSAALADAVAESVQKLHAAGYPVWLEVRRIP